MANKTDDAIERLTAKHPGWKIWAVYIYSRNAYEWCAMPANEVIARLHAWSADEMSDAIAEYESETVPDGQ